jgi:hypothetical protein
MIWNRAPPLPDDQRLDDPLLGDRRHQLGQVAHDLAWAGSGLASICSIGTIRPMGVPAELVRAST